VVTKDVDAYLAANPEPVIPGPPSDEASADGGAPAPTHQHDHTK
jgi:hypothetical protein